MAAAPRVDRRRHGGLPAASAAEAAAGEAITGDGDLVADVAAGRQKLATVKDDELPDDAAQR